MAANLGKTVAIDAESIRNRDLEEKTLAILRASKTPPDSPQIIKPVKCPRCYSTGAHCYATKDGVRYYRCRVCCDSEGRLWRFKVPVDPA